MNLSTELKKPHITEYISKLYDLGYGQAEVVHGMGAVMVTLTGILVQPIKAEGTSLFSAYSQAYQIAFTRATQKKEAA